MPLRGINHKDDLMIKILIFIAAFFLTIPTAWAEIVKKTSSGLCHSELSPYYERTKNFEPFDDLDSCISTGGRLPKGQRKSKKENDGYSRSKFGHGWSDEDGDCQSARHEALIAQSTTPVRFKSDDECQVEFGRWISPFSGEVIQDATTMDIDHVVPLKWAWDHGADKWSKEKRIKFANDPVNLFSVEASLNRSKGARGLSEWMPPAGKCGYASRFIRVAKIYKLKIPSQDKAVQESVCAL